MLVSGSSTTTTTTTVVTNSSSNQTFSNSSSSNSTQIIIIPGVVNNPCTGNSVLFGTDCFPCPEGLYKSGIQCLPCVGECVLCSSLTTCARCRGNLVPNANGTACVAGATICQAGFYK